MKYLLIVVFLASIASLEVFHELSGGDASGMAVCMAPQARQEVISDMLLRHQQNR